MRLLATALVLLLFGCEGGSLGRPSVTPAGQPREPGPVPAATNTRTTAADGTVVELRFDESLSFDVLRLRLVELNDSRCPQGVQCVWEGQAVATVEVSGDDLAAQTVELVLRAGVEPRAVAAAGYELRLLRVEPYPRAGVTPERREYVATISIRSS